MDKTIVPKFTIDRSVWLRGDSSQFDPTKPSGSYLLRELDRKRCCLGIYLAACGVPDEVLEGVASPGYLFRSRPEFRNMIPGWLISRPDMEDVNSLAGCGLMDVNDDTIGDDVEKEAYITRVFAEHGVEVTFV